MPRKKLTAIMKWEEIVDKVLFETRKTQDKGFRNWLESKKEQGYVMNSLMYRRCYNIWKAINKDNRDHFVCVTGKEGIGKSTLAINMAATIDPTFTVDRVCFNMENYVKGIKHAKPGQAFVLDEGNLFLFSRESLSSDNKFMLKLMALMRQRNLLTIICVPNFFTVDSYVRDHRVDTLLYSVKRGTFCCYVKKAINIISKEGRQTKQVGGHKIPDGYYFNGYFSKDFPKIPDLSKEAYEKHKAENFEQFLDDLNESIEKRKKESPFMSVTEATKALNISRDTLMKLIHNKEIKSKRLGNKYFLKKEDVLRIE